MLEYRACLQVSINTKLFQILLNLFLISSHPWHIVVGAAFKKYPNPENEDILGIDVIRQRLRNGVLHSERIIQSNFHIPVWATKVLIIIQNFKYPLKSWAALVVINTHLNLRRLILEIG